MTTENKLIGSNGSTVISDTAEHKELTSYMIIVQEDTVFAFLEVDELDASGEQGSAAYTYKAGAVLTPKGENFTKITLTSGSVIHYLC